LRTIQIAIGCEPPRTKRRWKQLEDALKAYWLVSKRAPFGGMVAVGFLWQLPKVPPWTKIPVLWRELVLRVGFAMKPDAVPCMGPSRFEQAKWGKLVLTLEGD